MASEQNSFNQMKGFKYDINRLLSFSVILLMFANPLAIIALYYLSKTQSHYDKGKIELAMKYLKMARKWVKYSLIVSLITIVIVSASYIYYKWDEIAYIQILIRIYEIIEKKIQSN